MMCAGNPTVTLILAVGSLTDGTFEYARLAPSAVFVGERSQQCERLENVVRRSGDNGSIPILSDEALVELAHRDAARLE